MISLNGFNMEHFKLVCSETNKIPIDSEYHKLTKNMCNIGSMYAGMFIESTYNCILEYANGLYDSQSHSFLIVDDEIVVDITVSQFDKNKDDINIEKFYGSKYVAFTRISFDEYKSIIFSDEYQKYAEGVSDV